LVDYPGKIASVIFFPFCNLRCPWCHNGDLINGNETNLITLKDALNLIEKRIRVLGAVVLSGGEPLLYPELGKLVSKIKEYNLLVKVDTNGMLPDTLLTLLQDRQTTPDYIALDLKIAPARYSALCYSSSIEEISKRRKPGGGKPDENGAELLLAKTVQILKDSGIPHEYRTVVLPHTHFSEDDVHPSVQ